MKKIITFVLFLALILGVFSFVDARSIRVRGYLKPSTGRYIAPHYRTSPNSYKWDNWSSKGNYNPFTGKRGTVSPWRW